MEIDKTDRQYTVKGGKTFLGRMFAYQKETGAAIKDIMKMPYIQFVIGMLDAPSIQYAKKEEIKEAKTAKEEIDIIKKALG